MKYRRFFITSAIQERDGRNVFLLYDKNNRRIREKHLLPKEEEDYSQTLSYNTRGMIIKTEDGRRSIFLYYNGKIQTECDGESAPVRRYLNGIGLSNVQTLADCLYHAYHQDEQGSTAYITEENRQVQNSYRYDAFGNLLESKEDIGNRILYTGQQYDQMTGQYYLRARYYNPVIGRFLQEDTCRGDGLNLYAYCANNPVMYYDSSGNPSWNACTRDNTPPNNMGSYETAKWAMGYGAYTRGKIFRGASTVYG